MEEKASKAYWEALKDATIHHAVAKTFSGKFLIKHYDRIKELIAKHKITSILDYGCGKGVQYTARLKGPNQQHDGPTLEEYWGIKVTKYDPAYTEFSAPPEGKFDMVICSHVLGCVPIQDLNTWFLKHLFSFGTKLVYIVERIGNVPTPSKKGWTQAKGTETPWTAMQWIDIIRPHIPPGLAVILCVAYPHVDGIVYGVFELSWASKPSRSPRLPSMLRGVGTRLHSAILTFLRRQKS